MDLRRTIFFVSIFTLVIGACSKRESETQFEDDVNVSDNETTQITPENQTTISTSTTATTTTGAGWTPSTTANFSSVPQTNAWASPTGWPYNTGYPTGNGGWSPYPSNYQTYNYQGFPNYHAQYGNGYYIASLTHLFRSILGRNPDYPALQFWLRETIAGRPFTNIREEFLKSHEAVALGDPAKVETVIGLYRTYFGRLPERSGLLYWVRQLQSGMSTQQLAYQFSVSGDYRQYSNGGLFTRPINDLGRAILGTNLQGAQLNDFVYGFARGEVNYVQVVDQFRGSPMAQQIGGLNAENCIAVHRTITGRLPAPGELACCVAKGQNNNVSAPNFYSPVLQAYAQQLMTTGACR